MSQSKINPRLKSFLLKMFLIITIWKVLYVFLLKPIRFPDKYLTEIITAGVVWFSNFIHLAPNTFSWIKNIYNNPTLNGIILNKYPALLVEDSCNGLELMLIYIGIILLIPNYSKLRKATFIIGGTFILIAANIVRCTGLLWLQLYHKVYFEFNHHYVFTLFIYLIIFGLWSLFTSPKIGNEVK